MTTAANTVDIVNHPPHYTDGKAVETIDVIKNELGQSGFESFLHGQIIKYLSRAGKKGSRLEDLQKAEWYLKRLISEMTS